MGVVHHFDVETPPEGLLVWEAVARWPGEACCGCFDPSPRDWFEPDLPLRRALPGETVDVRMYLQLPGHAYVSSGHVLQLHFRKAEDDQERLTAFRWTPAPPRRVPA